MRGIDKFQDHFSAHKTCFVLIGGAACYLQMDNLGLDFRATKDLDIVIVVEAVSDEFIATFWKFVRNGRYSTLQKSTGKHVFYRFHSPEDQSYPHMIELFSRAPINLENETPGGLTPIPTLDESISSLSAILLDEQYYALLHSGTEILLDMPVLKPEYIFLFKAKAWIDLNDRMKRGEVIDSKTIKKHRNDTIRLSQIISKTPSVQLPKRIAEDLTFFLQKLVEESIVLSDLGIRNITIEDTISTIRTKFMLGLGETNQ
jgi:hypothetical protein